MIYPHFILVIVTTSREPHRHVAWQPVRRVRRDVPLLPRAIFLMRWPIPTLFGEIASVPSQRERGRPPLFLHLQELKFLPLRVSGSTRSPSDYVLTLLQNHQHNTRYHSHVPRSLQRRL